jgi:hypothetical protein
VANRACHDLSKVTRRFVIDRLVLDNSINQCALEMPRITSPRPSAVRQRSNSDVSTEDESEDLLNGFVDQESAAVVPPQCQTAQPLNSASPLPSSQSRTAQPSFSQSQSFVSGGLAGHLSAVSRTAPRPTPPASHTADFYSMQLGLVLSEQTRGRGDTAQ